MLCLHRPECTTYACSNRKFGCELITLVDPITVTAHYLGMYTSADRQCCGLVSVFWFFVFPCFKETRSSHLHLNNCKLNKIHGSVESYSVQDYCSIFKLVIVWQFLSLPGTDWHSLCFRWNSFGRWYVWSTTLTYCVQFHYWVFGSFLLIICNRSQK